MHDGRPVVTLYSVEGCHLCDAARDVVLATLRARAFRFDDIMLNDSDPRFNAYRERFPVVCVDGREIASWRITMEQLLAALQRRTGSG